MLTLLCSKSIRNGLWLPEHWAWDTQLHIEQVRCKSEALAFFFFALSVCVSCWPEKVWNLVQSCGRELDLVLAPWGPDLRVLFQLSRVRRQWSSLGNVWRRWVAFTGSWKECFVSLLANIVSLPQLHFFWSLPESIISTNHMWSSYQGYSLMHNKLIFFLSWVTVSSMSILQSNYFYFWFFQTGNSQILAWVTIIWGTCFFKKMGTFTLSTSP